MTVPGNIIPPTTPGFDAAFVLLFVAAAAAAAVFVLLFVAITPPPGAVVELFWGVLLKSFFIR